jgi:hypothetical protein
VPIPVGVGGGVIALLLNASGFSIGCCIGSGSSVGGLNSSIVCRGGKSSSDGGFSGIISCWPLSPNISPPK